VHSYGKAPENTFINIAFIFLILGFIASCFITVILVTHFLANETVYSGVAFSILALFFELIVLGLYLAIFKEFIDL
jgi:hypothetical protein